MLDQPRIVVANRAILIPARYREIEPLVRIAREMLDREILRTKAKPPIAPVTRRLVSR